MMFSAIRTALPALLLVASATFAAEPAPTEPAPTERAPAEAPAPNPSNAAAAEPASTSGAEESQPTSARAASGRRPANDRLDLDTTIVTGNRELPKVLYIVPWKKADLGDLPAQPFNTLLDEVLSPVDREVFRREVTYYGVVSSGGNVPGTAPSGEPARGPTRGDEK